jgi:hypothetical protein
MTNLLHTLFIDIQKVTNRTSYACGTSTLVGILVFQLVGSTAFGAVSGGRPFANVKGNFDNPAVLPVHSNAFGTTYEELAGKFWQWEFSMPLHASPVYGTADCSTNQSGKVWFLAASAEAFETAPGVILRAATRNCNVPNGTALFVPVINAECSTIPGDKLPPFGPTPAELKPCSLFASSFIDRSKLIATVDGVPIKALGQYQVTSPLFTFGPLPNNNILESFGLFAPAGTTAQAVSTGIHLLLHPLPAGQHTIYIHAEVDVTPIGGPRLIFDTTYHLTVGKD